MRAIGLDIGTTTLSAVVVDTINGGVQQSLTVANDTAIPAEPFARLQDPELIWRKTEAMLAALKEGCPDVAAIGLTGQMHGLLYADADGRALSPLFTWQDGRGELPMPDGECYQARLAEITGQKLATGYGAVTHYYLLQNGLLPPGAASAMTIHDYIGMKLTGRKAPLTHISDAASFGATDWPDFAPYLHLTSRTELLGHTASGVPVAVGIGDNQASFIGSVQKPRGSVLVNMGTGGQVSVALDGPVECPGCETRPYVDGGALLVGFSLCGGRSYALLERFLRRLAVLTGASDRSLYGLMNDLAELPISDELLVSTQFLGTRQDPSLRGSIRNLCEQNFTPEHLVQGVMRGMVDELHTPYLDMQRFMACKPSVLVGSGNGIRQNPALRRMFSEAFGMPLLMPAHNEEAAYGAALFALCTAGAYSTVTQAQGIIRYRQEENAGEGHGHAASGA